MGLLRARLMMQPDRLDGADRDIADVLSDQAASAWLKAALAALLRRDPVDAAADAAMLHQLIGARCAALLADAVDAADEPLLPLGSMG